MLFLQYLLMAIGAFVVLRIALAAASRVADAFRFRSLLQWLEMDSLEIARRMQARDLAGLTRDVHAKLKERQTLLLFKIERVATSARDAGDLPAEDAQIYLDLVRETRELQDVLAGELEFAGVYVGFKEGATEATRRILGPVVQESVELRQKTAFFYRFLNRNPSFSRNR